jgi:hypothetical protein
MHETTRTRNREYHGHDFDYRIELGKMLVLSLLAFLVQKYKY